MYYRMMGEWGWGFMFLFPLIILAIAAYIAYMIGSNRAAGSQGQTTGQGGYRSAEEILAERFAKGEISEEEYMNMKATLKK
ncbi:hypothetical protein EAL2_808p03320 (plasmid) [Peptoclostridium acidaminophilum DSM 3953]|uniref:SHOCT domain-containing protein n=1 Tax=Peptoclostridium acidaminophilum DSM 3953 TaxID=1286171 RepID=W8TNV3_PEPAC|nr:SHOCT domain-containing protein [Peptoclostridium acidaminophilum]AHM57837.1 hypothetical protein EAL2_808p03320 [Peptoclostridium acidaminophilum DSM 3953]